jgi:hypothetical protein
MGSLTLESFDLDRIMRGSTIAIVGASGTGKTSLARALLQYLAQPGDELVVYHGPDHGATCVDEYDGFATHVLEHAPVAPSDAPSDAPGILVFEDSLTDVNAVARAVRRSAHTAIVIVQTVVDLHRALRRDIDFLFVFGEEIRRWAPTPEVAEAVMRAMREYEALVIEDGFVGDSVSSNTGLHYLQFHHVAPFVPDYPSTVPGPVPGAEEPAQPAVPAAPPMPPTVLEALQALWAAVGRAVGWW